MTTILITGAAGSIGSKLRAHFQAKGDSLRLLDKADGGDGKVRIHDLSVWDERWAAAFAGVDAVIHLAGDPRPIASWQQVQQHNVQATANVVEAAVRARVPRLVLASSCWVMAGQRYGRGKLLPDDPPCPVNAYGASKLATETIARTASERDGLSVIVFRLGHCQAGPSNEPGPHMAMGRWGQSMWLSDGDLCQGFEKAVGAPANLRFAVLYLISANAGMRWDIEPTLAAIGYRPQDRSVPQSSLADACRSIIGRFSRRWQRMR